MAKIKILAGNFSKGNCDYSHGNFHFVHNKVISDKQLDAVEIATEENVKKIGGTIGWGVAGGAVFGPVGLLAGLLLGGKSKEVTFIAKFQNGMKFIATTDSKTFTKLQSITFNKNKDTNTNNLNNAMKNSTESKVNSIQRLIDLSNMLDRGLITDEEFKKYKKELESKTELENDKDIFPINSKYMRKDGKIYLLTKEGLTLFGSKYVTYNYEDSIELLSKTDEFTKSM